MKRAKKKDTEQHLRDLLLIGIVFALLINKCSN